MSEYLEHLNKTGAMVSSTLSSVLKEQIALTNELTQPNSMTAILSGAGEKILTDDIQDITFDMKTIDISFFAGQATMLKTQKLYKNKCDVSCGGIEKSGFCSKWSASRVSPTTFMVALKFQDSL